MSNLGLRPKHRILGASRINSVDIRSIYIGHPVLPRDKKRWLKVQVYRFTRDRNCYNMVPKRGSGTYSEHEAWKGAVIPLSLPEVHQIIHRTTIFRWMHS